MFNPSLKTKNEKAKLIINSILSFILSIGLLLFLNQLSIKNTDKGWLRVFFSLVGIGISINATLNLNTWINEDLEEAFIAKRKARNNIRLAHINEREKASIDAIFSNETIEKKELESIELIPFDWQSLRNARQYPHISLEEKTGGGKSTLAEYLGSLLGGKFIAIAPHYKKGDFPSASLIVGRGRNYGDAIEVLEGDLIELHQEFESVLSGENSVNVLEFLGLVHAEMRYRYTLDDYENTEKINIVLDEYNSYGSKKGVKELFKELIREARKVNIRLIILCQGSEVKALGIEGEGSLRENLTRIRLKNFALKEAKAQLNKCKEGSENQQYWQAVLNGLNNNNWSALVDDSFAVIPNLSNWSNHNPDQVILETNTTPPTTTTIDVQPLYNEDVKTCNHCGGDNVTKHSSNRIKCKDCGKTSTIKAKKK